MKDERIIILQMLEKGKITVEEAAALLDALEPAAVRGAQRGARTGARCRNH